MFRLADELPEMRHKLITANVVKELSGHEDNMRLVLAPFLHAERYARRVVVSMAEKLEPVRDTVRFLVNDRVGFLLCSARSAEQPFAGTRRTADISQRRSSWTTSRASCRSLRRTETRSPTSAAGRTSLCLCSSASACATASSFAERRSTSSHHALSRTSSSLRGSTSRQVCHSALSDLQCCLWPLRNPSKPSETALQS